MQAYPALFGPAEDSLAPPGWNESAGLVLTELLASLLISKTHLGLTESCCRLFLLVLKAPRCQATLVKWIILDKPHL